VIWTEGAFAQLDELFGTREKKSELKKGFHLPYANMANADLSRIINSDEVQATVRAVKAPIRRAPMKKNPLKNFALMQKLNPAAAAAKRRALKTEINAKEKKAALIKAKREGTPTVTEKDKAAKKAVKASGKAWFKAAIKGTDLV